MKILVTGSSGYLGSNLVLTLIKEGYDVIGIDIIESSTTNLIGSISNREFVKLCCKDINVIFHTASLHKPHIITHSNQDFIDTNVTGTLNLLEEAVSNGVSRFIFTSTTSIFGKALVPSSDNEPTTWITEKVIPIPKNIYGITKLCAENLCQLFHQQYNLPCIILRTSRFFPESDDNPESLSNLAMSDENMKFNEYLYRRVHLEDVISAHTQALHRALELRYGVYIISSTSPFNYEDIQLLRGNGDEVVQKYYPEYVEIYQRKGWKMLTNFDRVYVNDLARKDLHWEPKYTFPVMILTIN